MRLNQSGACLTGSFDGVRTLCIGAHPDDAELLAIDAIFGGEGFGAVVVTDGAGSPRAGAYADVTNEEMVKIRRAEQITAAERGGYRLCVQLAYPSAALRQQREELVTELSGIISRCAPETVYTHNLWDRHPTHLGVAMSVIEAIRALPPDKRPGRLLGGEAWRCLDWLSSRVVLPVAATEEDVLRIWDAFRSQIAGGKRYDLAVLGRLRANATFGHSHEADECSLASYAADMTALVDSDAGIPPEKFMLDALGLFKSEALAALRAL